VTLSPDLNKLSHAEKDALIQALTEQLAAAQERIATRDARIAAYWSEDASNQVPFLRAACP
jgi:hypothetical protein